MGTTINQTGEIPPFSEPYLPITVHLTTTNDTQIMHVPYNLGDKTVQILSY